MRTYEQAYAEYLAECYAISAQCVEEGYPSHGSNYDLRVESIRSDYPEVFDPYYYDDDDPFED